MWCGVVAVEVGFEGVEQFAGYVAFHGADDVFVGEAFCASSFAVCQCFLVLAESADGDEVDGGVGVTVTATVEPHPVGFS